MSKAKSAKEVLIATKWIINHIGWSKGTMYRDQKRQPISNGSSAHPEKVYSCCLLGAIELVNAEDNVQFQAISCLIHAAGGHIISWNDTKGRTKKDVRALLNKAISDAI